MRIVFIDVDTQLDFLYPAGALYVPGADRLVLAIERLNRFAAAHGFPVVSTTDAHTENDPEFLTWPPYRIVGTTGRRKAAGTLLDRRVVAPDGECEVSLEGARQIIVEEQTFDAFAAPSFRRVLDGVDANRFVVYGVVTEISSSTRHACWR